jgi:PKD repeat protein
MTVTAIRAGISRLMLVAACVSFGPVARGADCPYLYGIHWWGYTSGQGIDSTPATLLDCPAYGGWSLETVLTHSASWWSASYFAPLYADLYNNKNMSLITRIDYDWGQTVPSPTNPNYASWPAAVRGVADTLGNQCHIWIVGNEPNIVGEGNGWPDGQITPSAYAQIYRNVRAAVHAGAPSPAGPHRVLVAPPSPGSVIPGVRWMDGNQWLGAVIDNIPHDEIDGFAIHAYGFGVVDFRSGYTSQLNLIDNKGLWDRPVYLTEWNRYTTPGSASAEAVTAQFIRDAFADVHAWNNTPGGHNIICMTWFVYDSNQQAGGSWDGYAIEYWRNAGNPLGSPDDIFTAFEQTVDLRYPAGIDGTPMLPPIANFVGRPLSGVAPVPVQFTDSTQGIIDTYAWDFGDGGDSAEENPAHTYTRPGVFTVSLTASGPAGADAETKPDYITVYAASDFDRDGDVDLSDYGDFLFCYNGPNRPPPISECDVADFDGDGDVDLGDYAEFLSCYNGPGRTPVCS